MSPDEDSEYTESSSFFRLLQKSLKNHFCRHAHIGGYPESFVFKGYWIPDTDSRACHDWSGNDE
jgi:hypothetical protein